MPTVKQIAREIVAREGGFVNDPDDLGGATNLGVTLGVYQRLGRDQDGDGDIESLICAGCSPTKRCAFSWIITLMRRVWGSCPNRSKPAFSTCM